MDTKQGRRIIDLKDRIVAHFDYSDWQEIGLITGEHDLINGHGRLLRSLAFGDQDYAGNVISVLTSIASRNVGAFDEFDRMLDRKYPGEAHYISVKQSPRKLTFAPHVFEVPEFSVEADLVAIMMPFGTDFKPVSSAIKAACTAAGYRSKRADDIWEEHTIIQDIFNLILRAPTVIVDFTGKNPNVMYETGIAHTLGKLVIPITQSISDVPFDVTHHRVLKYLPNAEGYAALTRQLTGKLTSLGR